MAQLASSALQAVALILVARWGTPEEFGRLAATLAILTVMVSLSDFGLATLLIRTRAREPSSGTIHDGMALVRILSIGGAGFAILVVFALNRGQTQWIDVGLLAVLAILERWMQAYLGLSVSDGRAQLNLVVLSLTRGATVVIMWWLVSGAALSPSTAYAGAGAATALLGYIGARSNVAIARSNLGSLSSRHLFRQAFPFWVATTSQQVRNLDVSIVAIVASHAVAGIYAVPARISAPLRMLTLTLNRIALPYASRGDAQMLASLRRVMRIVFIAMTVLLSLLFYWAEQAIVITIGESYTAAVWPLRIMLIGILVNVAGAFKSGLLQGSGDEVFIARLGVVLALLSIASIAVGAYFLGATGAAIAGSSVYMVQFLCVFRRPLRIGSVKA